MRRSRLLPLRAVSTLVLLACVLCLRPIAGAAAPAAAPAAPATLSAADRQQVLGILKDPARLKAFTTTLEQMNRAVAATQPSGVAAAAGLAPHSLGAEILDGLGGLGGTLRAQVGDFTHIARDFRDVGPWFASISRDGPRRATVLGSLARLAIVLALAAAVTWAVRRLIRRPVAALERLGRAAPAPPPLEDEAHDAHDEHDAHDADVAGASPRSDAVPFEEDVAGAGISEAAMAEGAAEREASLAVLEAQAGPDRVRSDAAIAADEARLRSRHSLNYRRLLHALRRLPLAAARFLLELAVVLVFALAAAVLQAVGLVQTIEARMVVATAIRTFVFAGVGIALVNTLFGPQTPSLRLILVRDETARIVAFWLRLMLVVGAVGLATVAVLQTLGIDAGSALALTRIVVLLEHTLLAVLIFRIREPVARRLQPPRRVEGLVARAVRRYLRQWWVVAIFFDFAFWVVWAAQLRHGFARLWTFTLDTAAILFVAWLVQTGLQGALAASLRTEEVPDGSTPFWLRARLRAYGPTLRRMIVALVTAATLIALLQVWGFHAFAWFHGGALGGRVVSASVSILVALVFGIAMWEALNLAADRHIARLELDETSGAARIARLRTLLPILRITLLVFIATILLLTVLTQVGVNVAPLLGGAGILGVALGFGSQKLVQDFITGIFLLLENTMQVGDFVTAAGLSGSVEHLSIRTLRLRAGDGSVHMIPFSSVTTVTNVNRGQGNAAVSVDIDPREDTDRVADLLKEIVLGMRADPDYADGMLTDLQFWGVDKVTSQAVTLVGQIGCTDKSRWGVQREFNRRLRIAFAQAGVSLAVPRQGVSIERDPPPLEEGVVADAEPGSGATNVIESPPQAALGNTA